MNYQALNIQEFQLRAIDIEKELNLDRKISKIKYFAQQSRIEVFEMIHRKGNGHWGGSSSCAELLSTLYLHTLQIDPTNIQWEDRDRLILSKGHAAPILYTLLAHKGFFSIVELSTFRSINSRLQGHPCMLKTPGVELSTGPLGHGISVGVGMALAAKVQKKKYWTYVIVGDGCLNEGQSWEGLMSASKFKPPRLIIMVDYNKIQLDGPSSEIMPLDPLVKKFEAFNLMTAPKIYNGHEVHEIIDSLDWAKRNGDQPCVIIYETHKGKGVSFMEDNFKWHGGIIDNESYKMGKAELETTLMEYLYEIK